MNVPRKSLNAAIVIEQRCRVDGLAKKPTGEPSQNAAQARQAEELTRLTRRAAIRGPLPSDLPSEPGSYSPGSVTGQWQINDHSTFFTYLAKSKT